MKANRVLVSVLAGAVVLTGLVVASGGPEFSNLAKMGKQADGRIIVSSDQVLQPPSFSFKGRPADIAARPQGDVFAMSVMSQVFTPSQIVLCNQNGPIQDGSIRMSHHPGFHGLGWSPDGKRLLVSTGERNNSKVGVDGVLEVYSYADGKLTREPDVTVRENGEPDNIVPGGFCFNRDGSRLYLACCDLNAVLELDGTSFKRLRKIPVGMIPFTVKLSEDEKTLMVSNWGGRVPLSGDDVSQTGISKVVVDKRGMPGSGTVSLVDLSNGSKVDLPVGIHPSDIVVQGTRAYVANSMSDTISEIDLGQRKVSRTIGLEWENLKLLGSMPCALAIKGSTLYACNGGDNSLAEIDLNRGKVIGYRSAGYFPVGMFLQGGKAIVANSKGEGSIANTSLGKVGNAHDFQGSVSIIDLSQDLKRETEVVAGNNHWDRKIEKPNLPVYRGAIKHVLYIIKENRTYDEIYGDMPEGNGDPKLCTLGEKVMPNHRALAREFTLFDNAYVSGTNSNDGHAWSTQGIANDYIEHFYVGYSRTYNDDGNCAMSLANSGAIWNSALKKGLSFRDYGEFVVADDAQYKPYRPKDWFEAWQDRKMATHKFTYIPHTRIEGLRPYVHPTVHYWPLIQSDQSRADEFIKDFTMRDRNNTVPNLMILSLCCDHSEGIDPDYPQPKCMMADNDLALGRVVDAISHSDRWKDTAICVIEDDAQSGMDHVDGHRTSYLVISAYNKRHFVDHTRYTTTTMLRSIEDMLGFDPMNRMDALARPITTCFNSTPDLTPYNVQPNNIPLDLPNPGRSPATMSAKDKYWTMKSQSLNWSHLDGPSPYWLNRVVWYSLKGNEPYPEVAQNNQPEESATDDDD
jgi:YVTN family beta-propeller protein